MEYRHVLAIEDLPVNYAGLSRNIRETLGLGPNEESKEGKDFYVGTSLADCQSKLQDWKDQDFEERAGILVLRAGRNLRLDAILDIYMDKNKGQGDYRPSTGLFEDAVFDRYMQHGGVVCFRSGFADNARELVRTSNEKYANALVGYSQKGTEVPVVELIRFVFGVERRSIPTLKKALMSSQLGHGDFNKAILALKARK